MLNKASIFAIDRHRINIDGSGIVTLVGFMGCPLSCKYCINNICHHINSTNHVKINPHELYEKIKIDDLYFRASGGGVTFGGGEPGLQYAFIEEFRKLCPTSWNINIETSLNFSSDYLEILIRNVDLFIIDVKDLDPNIYHSYTKGYVTPVIKNLLLLRRNVPMSRIKIRVPHIPFFNTKIDVDDTITRLHSLGFDNLDICTYKILNNDK